MRYGFTTGSCAAAAAKAAVYMLLTGKEKKEISIETPKGIIYHAKLVNIHCNEREASCAVVKDGGDDPDVTSGLLICAKVTQEPGNGLEILIDGGSGVGRVTKPGLDQPIGNAAINHVPREMIQKEVTEVCELLDYKGKVCVEIFVPQGEQVAAQTFNPRLGVVGGISILGTSGIVEPMSSRALLDTIRVELNQRRAEGYDSVVVSPGNYGQDFLWRTYRYDLERSVKCSNFIGETMDMAVELGFQRLLLVGHIGKLIKVSGGIMNTHSKEGDCRMELLAAFSVRAKVPPAQIAAILECATTEEAVRILKEAGKLAPVMELAMERICYYLRKRTKNQIDIDCMMYANAYGELAKSKGVTEWFTLLEQEPVRSI